MTTPQRETQLVFNKDNYEVDTLEQAKALILTPESGTTTEERWENETPYLCKNIGALLEPSANDCVLDYGCGTGRLSKALFGDNHPSSLATTRIPGRLWAPRKEGAARLEWSPQPSRGDVPGGRSRSSHPLICHLPLSSSTSWPLPIDSSSGSVPGSRCDARGGRSRPRWSSGL